MATVSLPAPVMMSSVDEPLPRLSSQSSPLPVRTIKRSMPAMSTPWMVCTPPVALLAQTMSSVAADQSMAKVSTPPAPSKALPLPRATIRSLLLLPLMLQCSTPSTWCWAFQPPPDQRRKSKRLPPAMAASIAARLALASRSAITSPKAL